MENLLKQISIYTIIGIFIGISQAIGIGGGPIINALLMIGFNYNLSQSTFTTLLILFGASLASIVISLNKKPMIINIKLILITLPVVTIGSIHGSILHNLLSEFITTILFVLLLSMIIKKSIRRLSSSNQKLNTQQQSQIKNISIKQQYTRKDIYLIVLIILISIFILLFLIIRGTQAIPSILNISFCSKQFWLIFTFMTIFQLAIAYYLSKVLKIMSCVDNQPINSLKLVAIGYGSGVMGGTLGIGGAVIHVPAWNWTGISEDVAAQSSPVLIFLSVIISLLTSKQSQNVDIVMFQKMLYGFICSFYIRKLIQWLKEKLKIKRCLSFVFISVLLITLILFVPFQIIKYTNHPNQFISFGKYCKQQLIK